MDDDTLLHNLLEQNKNYTLYVRVTHMLGLFFCIIYHICCVSVNVWRTKRTGPERTNINMAVTHQQDLYVHKQHSSTSLSLSRLLKRSVWWLKEKKDTKKEVYVVHSYENVTICVDGTGRDLYQVYRPVLSLSLRGKCVCVTVCDCDKTQKGKVKRTWLQFICTSLVGQLVWFANKQTNNKQRQQRMVSHQHYTTSTSSSSSSSSSN